MAPQVKVRAKVKSKSKEAKLNKRNDVVKIKRKKVSTTKTKDSKPITALPPRCSFGYRKRGQRGPPLKS